MAKQKEEKPKEKKTLAERIFGSKEKSEESAPKKEKKDKVKFDEQPPASTGNAFKDALNMKNYNARKRAAHTQNMAIEKENERPIHQTVFPQGGDQTKTEG